MVRDGVANGWFVVGVFGFGTILSLASTITGGSLALTPDGFTVRGLGRDYRFHWTDVEEFGVYKIGWSTFVGVNYASHYEKHSRLRWINQVVDGYEAGFYAYGMKAEELVELMNRWRQLAIEQSQHQPDIPGERVDELAVRRSASELATHQ